MKEIDFKTVRTLDKGKLEVKWHLESNRGEMNPSIEDELNQALKLKNLGLAHSQYGTTEEKSFFINGKERKFVLHTPLDYQHQTDQKVKLILFFHGSRESAWNAALRDTRLIELSNTLYHEKNEVLLIAFGQARGKATKNFVKMHSFYDYQITFGEFYWEIRDYNPEFQTDLLYTTHIIDQLCTEFNVDKEFVYYIGHSNGGVFGCLLSVYLPNHFRAICSHMGGIGWDPSFYLDFEKLKEGDKKTPMFLVTSEFDVHLHPTKAAFNLYKGEEFPNIQMVVKPNTDHTYLPDIEPSIWNFFHQNY